MVAILIIFVIAIFFFIPYEKLINFPDLCLWKRFFGVECIGCGTIRAFWKVLHFQFKEAFYLNRLVYLYIVLLIFIFYKSIRKINKKCKK